MEVRDLGSANSDDWLAPENLHVTDHKEGQIISGMLLMQCGCTYVYLEERWQKAIICAQGQQDNDVQRNLQKTENA